jgi:putative acetyltransferase
LRITVREILPEDARLFMEVHRSAVRGIAARDYPPDIIENWARIPITQASLENFLINPDKEIRLVGEMDGEIVGIGALVVEKTELRACYVSPNAVRKGVGTAIVREIERIAVANGLTFLQMDSSVTAEPFYKSLGYEVLEYGEHVLSSGQRMACVRMRKAL